jgi:hypothetical protein
LVRPEAGTVTGLPLMLLPAALWVSRYCFTKPAAACERSLSHHSMPSSSVEKMPSAPAPGWAAVQAALTAAMIGASGTRLRSPGSVGDWPCLAEMMRAVLEARPCNLISATILPTWVLR